MTKRKCTAPGCDRPARYRSGEGLCSMHAERWRTHKSLDLPPTARTYRQERPLPDRVWEKVLKTDGCWLWMGSYTNGGYGQVAGPASSGKTMLLVHRVVWELLHGPIPDGLVVCHHCDNPPCCNPRHLFLGTHQDNTLDMVRKGRAGGNSLPDDERRARLEWLQPKTCSRCGQTKPPEMFGPNRARKDGLQVYCRPCWAQWKRERQGGKHVA
jgi:hypothetical protein